MKYEIDKNELLQEYLCWLENLEKIYFFVRNSELEEFDKNELLAKINEKISDLKEVVEDLKSRMGVENEDRNF